MCLSAVLLTGCEEDRIEVGRSIIVIEEGKAMGNIFYEDIDQNIRIHSFNQDEQVLPTLENNSKELIR